MFKLREWIKTKRARGEFAMVAYGVSLAVNFFTSGRALAAFGTVVLAAVISVFLFWPELKRLRITYPKGTYVESPGWLYIFGLAVIAAFVFASYRLYESTATKPRAVTADLYAQQYIHGQYIRLSDFVDPNNEIVGRTFEDDYIYGPVAIALVDHNDIGLSNFEGGALSFLAVASLKPNTMQPSPGVIYIHDSKFRRCHFIHITVLATPEMIQQWKADNPSLF